MNKIKLLLMVALVFVVSFGYGFEVQAKVKKEKSHALSGKASWYGGKFHGRLTASGTVYNKYTHTAAHKTLPFGTVVEVIDAQNSKRTVVCITDRGPYVRGRVIDLSKAAADELAIGTRGITPVKLRIVSDIHGKTLNDNEAFFVQIHGLDQGKKEKIGPYQQFADANVMKEVLVSEHPEALVIVDSTSP